VWWCAAHQLSIRLYWKNAMSPVTDRVRGVVSPIAAGGQISHGRVAASEPLRGVVQHFWSVRWDLRGAKPFVSETLPHPNVHMVFETEGASVVGVHTGRFTTKLEDAGWVFGVKFRPGAFRAYLGRSVASLRDRTVPIDEVFGTEGAALARQVSELGEDCEKAATVERFLNERTTPSDPNVERVSHIVDGIAENRAIVSVEQVVALGRVNKRTLQQLFNTYVGVGPKWVINRYRLHEAVERLQKGAHINFTELAADLGYFDQAHFIRDFRKLVGCSPAAFIRRLEGLVSVAGASLPLQQEEG
jgi:AraC-like DNA-binding protein